MSAEKDATRQDSNCARGLVRQLEGPECEPDDARRQQGVAALLADLEAAGVRLSLAGDRLHFQTRRGVIIAPYQERIIANKPALLVELLKARIIDVVTMEPDHFDRAEYERLWARWNVYESTGPDWGLNSNAGREALSLSEDSASDPGLLGGWRQPALIRATAPKNDTE